MVVSRPAEIGVNTGRMLPENAAALVGAGMISVFLFPLGTLLLRRQTGEKLLDRQPDDLQPVSIT